MAGGKFAGGDGSQLNPFLIEDAHDFNAIRLYSSGYHFQLIKDINMNTPPYNIGTGWQPLPSFNGKIDGQGHKVTGLRIWSTGNDVGLFLASNTNYQLNNIHFDDVYMELVTDDTDTRSKKFTFFGLAHNHTETFNPLNGVSLIGKFKVQSPGVVARLVSYSLYQPNGGKTVSLNDCYFEVENIGDAQINLFGTISSNFGSSKIRLKHVITKCKGKFVGFQPGGYGSIEHADSYLVDDIDTEYTSFSGFVKQTPEFLSKAENIPTFVDSSYLGRQLWFFPGNTHVRMMDYSRNRFLIEADGLIYSYSVEQGLHQVGNAPVLTDMFVLYGMDYIESVPVSVWNQLRQDYGTVDIHCYVEKIPGKSLVTNREALVFNQALDSKVVMKTIIDFSEHNNDINRIRVPAVEPVPVVTEPTEPETGTTEPDNGTTEPDTGTNEPGATDPESTDPETTEPII